MISPQEEAALVAAMARQALEDAALIEGAQLSEEEARIIIAAILSEELPN
jgi:hypothetical protein